MRASTADQSLRHHGPVADEAARSPCPSSWAWCRADQRVEAGNRAASDGDKEEGEQLARMMGPPPWTKRGHRGEERDLKRNPAKLATLAAGLFVMRQVDIWWLISPNFYPTIHVSWLDLLLTAGLGALWLRLLIRQSALRVRLCRAYYVQVEEEVAAHG